MSHKVVLSNAFNMSLGFIPVIISILLNEFIPVNTATSIGAGMGLLMSVFSFYRTRQWTPNNILYISTVILAVYALLDVTHLLEIPAERMPFILEVSIVLPLLILYFFRGKYVTFYKERMAHRNRCSLVQGAESTVVAIRVLLIFTVLHLIAVFFVELFSLAHIGPSTRHLLFHILPLLVFVFSVLFNQYGVIYFNKIMAETQYIAVVDSKGKVIGKVLKIDAQDYKNLYTNVVIRIIPMSHGMIFLSERDSSSILDQGKVDTPFETFLNYQEKIEEGVDRLLKTKLPGAEVEPTFALKYTLKNEETSRLVYLFLLEIPDDKILCDCHLSSGKLWTLPQMEQNLGMNYFSSCLENEYELLKEIIDTREKYRES